jgi:RNA polymerase sigma factor (sigma-70 family)
MRGQTETANKAAAFWVAPEEWRALYARARFLAQDCDEAQDLVQETLLRAVTATPHWEDAARRRAWLLAVLRNLFIDRCRARRVIAKAEREASCIDTDAVPENTGVDVLDVLSTRDLEEACRSLCELDRELLTRTCFQGRSHKEVAAAVGIERQTLDTRLFRARRRLRRVLQALFDSRMAMRASQEHWERPASR